ncbi:PREDICTED: cytochrome b561 domain-containing protein At2g30890 [Tarenaya hassleriana]|uniref:cytochrome b561 domain-containing protein At2g30890 n=1 Tax=Tarenaya hassleriana TaxID=28532 RepID=UPI00053C8D45|nr:PREDICTED: cytochrome b561 domain-containing protein At2g30890 [Tarenaya hassleriana]
MTILHFLISKIKTPKTINFHAQKSYYNTKKLPPLSHSLQTLKQHCDILFFPLSLSLSLFLGKWVLILEIFLKNKEKKGKSFCVHRFLCPYETMEFLHHLLAFLLLLLPPCSSHESTRSLAIDANGIHPSSEKLISWKILYEVKVHGFLLWASMGLLMPIGILSIRMPNKDRCRRLFYLHVTSQMSALILVTVGAVMSIRNFNNSFDNYHQRIGIGLYIVVWFQALLGFLRPPPRGHKARSPWFMAHWILGTSTSLLGILNIYTGLYAYSTKTSTSVKLWTILFTVQVSCFAFFFLFQEKWSYVRNLSDQNNVSTAGDEFRESTPAPEKC